MRVATQVKTRIQKAFVASLIFASAIAACADTRTWSGNGADANWGTPANWGGSVPVSGDALVFSGALNLVNTNNLSAETTFSGVTLASGSGAFTLYGNGFAWAGDLVNLDNDAQTLQLPITLDVVRVVNASAGPIVLGGAIGGSGGLAKTGENWLYLNAANSYDGATVVSTVMGVLGGYLRLGADINLAEPLVLNGELNNGGTLNSSSGSNTLSGPVTCYNQVRLQINGGTLVVSGGVRQADGSNGGLFVINSGSAIMFNTHPLDLGAKTFYTDAGALTVLGVSGNTWASTMVANGTLRLDVPDALPPTAALQIGVGYGPGGTLNLNGNSQTIAKLYVGSTSAGARVITSPTCAVLTVNQSEATSFDGAFTGAVGLCKTGSGTLTLTGSATTTTGDICVSNGTLVVAAASSLGNSTNVWVAGGTLALQTGAAISDGARVAIDAGGAQMNIGAGLTETVDALVLDGVQQRRGTYGATGSGAATLDNAHFGGGGVLRVLSNPPVSATNYTWDAGAGGNTALSAAANWQGDVQPDLSAGTTYAVFGTAGDTATIDAAAALYGIGINRDNDFALADGSGSLTLGKGGVAAAAPSSTYRTYSVSESLALDDNQTWTVGNNTTLAIWGRIGDGEFPMNLSKAGSGLLTLAGDNSYDGVTTVTDGGILVKHNHGLGSAAGGTVVNTVTPSGSSAYVAFDGGVTLPEPLSFVNGSVNGSCLVNWGGSNTVSGPITTTSSRFFSAGGSYLEIAGGATGPSPFFVLNANGTIAFTTTPLDLGNGTFWTDSGGLTILAVAGNKWGETMVTGGTLRTDVTNAFPATTALRVGGVWYAPNATLDLNGCDQVVGSFNRAEPTPGTIVVTSARPAVLTVTQSGSTTFDGKLTGAVGVAMAGTGTLTLANAQNDTVGAFVVSNGTLAVAANTRLGNSSGVWVSGTGTLSLQGSTSIDDAATLTIDGNSAKVNLSSGVNETVGWLVLGGKLRRAGTYGATGSGAAVIDDVHFAGSGLLTVLHDKSGTLMKMR